MRWIDLKRAIQDWHPQSGLKAAILEDGKLWVLMEDGAVYYKFHRSRVWTFSSQQDLQRRFNDLLDQQSGKPK